MENIETEYMPLSYLRPNPKNPRKINEESLIRLMNSIQENPDFFEARPIVASRQDDGYLLILGGHQRYLAAMKLGLDEVPVTVMDNLTEDREDEILLLDNHSAGSYDTEKLKKLQPQLLDKLGIKAPIEKPKGPKLGSGKFVKVSFSEEEFEAMGGQLPSSDELKQYYLMFREED
nr:MAG TPA: ParB protein [Caudoviricetes sp.]